MLIHIDVDSASGPSGMISVGDGDPIRFDGWLALLRALSDLLVERSGPKAP